MNYKVKTSHTHFHKICLNTCNIDDDASNHIPEHYQLTKQNIDWNSAQCLTHSTNYFND